MKKLMTMIVAVALSMSAGLVFAAEPEQKATADQMSLPGIVIEELGTQVETEVQKSLQTYIEKEFNQELSMRLEIQVQDLIDRFESSPETLAAL